MCSIIIYIISCLFQNFHLFVFSGKMRTLPGPMRLPFLGTASFLLQKPEGNINNNNNNNNNSDNNVIICLINKEL